MKKFLSLVLALVMTMSLVTVSAGAKDFTDSSKIQYAEAVDVMSAVKVIDGYTDGSFNPSATLTRGAAAKIICNLILGPTTASALVADAAPYKDVPTNHTFAGYIAYCQKTGIISGYADGTFKPANSLTGYAFMKMLLGALGYKADQEGYTGANWSINVAKRALNIGLADDLVGDFNGVKAVNREEACLYAFNTLKATMVEYDKNSTVIVGNITIKEQSDAKEMANTGKTDGNIDKDGKMQFAEKYFTDLKGVATTDEFSRPATMWKVKSEEIGTYTDTADATYTKKVEIGDIYKDLGLGKSISAKKVSVYVDGVENPDQPARDITKGDDKNKYGDNGVLTEVFYDNDNDSVIITEVNTYVGTITKTVKATDKKDAYVVVAPESEKPTNFKNEFETDDKFEDDDYVLYTYSLKEKEIESVAAATKVEGTVTVAENSVTNNSDKKALTINGTKYKASAKISGENLSDVSVKQDYTIYLDSYGYMIYVEENEEIGDYALILNIKNGSNDWYLGNRAELLFTDGTTKIVTTDRDYFTKKGMEKNDIVTYKVNDGGEYVLKALPDEKIVSAKSIGDETNDTITTNKTLSMENNKAGLKINGTTYTANSASVFVVADAGSTDDYTAYTGVKNAPSIDTTKAAKFSETVDTYAYCKSGKMITVMFVFPGKDVEINDATSNALFVANGSVSNLIHDNDGDYFTFSAVVDGELKTVKVAQDVKVDGVKQTEKQIKKNFGGLFKSYTTDKGIITSVKTYEDYDKNQDVENESAVNGTVSGIDKVSKEYTVKLGLQKNGEYKYTITVDKDAKIFYVNTDDEISVSSYSAIAKDDNDVVYAVVKDYMVKTLIVYEQDGNDANPVKPELSKDVEVKSVDIDTPNTTITYYVEAGAKTLSTSDIKAILADKGCKDITKSKDGTWTFTYDGMTFEGVTVVTTQVYVVTFKCAIDKYTVTPNKVTVAAGETVKGLKLSGGTGWTNYSVSADEGTATATATDDLAVTFKWEAPSNLAADTQVTISYQA
ncbi:S-layer homology domain-containing protein [Dysosmobacter sp.]|uniref:S-layer homology domain-containing protein n=1 Tax=Dysosmobacter sp. TaxID=2591382 RepID=UPI003AF8D399